MTDAAKTLKEEKKKSTAARKKELKAHQAARIEELGRKLAEIAGKTAKEPDIVIPNATTKSSPDDYEDGVYDAGYLDDVTSTEASEAPRGPCVNAHPRTGKAAILFSWPAWSAKRYFEEYACRNRAHQEAREKLLEAARRREIDVVPVWRLDRLPLRLVKRARDGDIVKRGLFSCFCL